MRDRIMHQKLHEAQLQAQIQGMMQPQGGGGGPPGGAPPEGGAGQQPGMGMTGGPSGTGGTNPAPPPMLARPKGLGQTPSPPAGQPPMGITLDAVKKALLLVVDKLKGSVF